MRVALEYVLLASEEDSGADILRVLVTETFLLKLLAKTFSFAGSIQFPEPFMFFS